MAYPLQSNKVYPHRNQFRPKRSAQRLNETEIKILHFLVKQFKDITDGYHTYSSDPKLRKVVKKSKMQLNRALRHLHSWTLLESSGRGKPILYWIDPDHVKLVRTVLENGNFVSALLVLAWARNQMGWFTSRDIAKLLNVSKRHAQKLIKTLVDNQLIKRYRLKGKGFKGRTVYVEAKGQLPLSHFLRSTDTILNIKNQMYQTTNPFS